MGATAASVWQRKVIPAEQLQRLTTEGINAPAPPSLACDLRTPLNLPSEFLLSTGVILLEYVFIQASPTAALFMIPSLRLLSRTAVGISEGSEVNLQK